MSRLLIENIQIPSKRLEFLEQILKLLTIKKRTFNVNTGIKKEFNEIISKFNEFKGSIKKVKNIIKNDLISFLNSNNILYNVRDFNLKKHLLNIFEEISIDIKKIKDIQNLKVRDKKEQLYRIKKSYDEKLINNTFNKINNYLDNIENIINKIIPNPNLKELQHIGSMDELRNLFIYFNNLKLIPEEQVINSFFKYVNDKLIGILKNKKLTFSFIQIKKAFTTKKINEAETVKYIQNTLLVELVASLIIFLLNSQIEFDFDDLIKISNLSSDIIIKAIFLLMDRRLLDVIIKDNTINYKLICDIPPVSKILKNIIDLSKNFNKLREFQVVNYFFIKIDKIKNIISKNSEIMNEENILKYLKLINDEIQLFNDKIIEFEKQGQVNRLNLRVLAGIELFNMKKIPLVFEKGQFLQTENTEDNFNLANFLDQNLLTEFNKALIIVSLKNYGPMTPFDLSNITKIEQKEIIELLLTMLNDKQIDIVDEKKDYFIYDVPHVLSQAEKFLDTLFDNIYVILNDLDFLLKISEINGENFQIVFETLLKIDEELTNLSNIKYNSNKVIRTDLNNILKDYHRLLRTFDSISRNLGKKEIDINIENLIPIKIPKIKYETEFDYEQYIVGFGKIYWDIKKCIACKSCEEVCPESALNLVNEWDIQEIFKLSKEELDELPINKKMIINIIKNIALKIPSKPIKLPENFLGLGTINITPIKCIACQKCVERCPNGAIEFKKVWDLPEIVSEYLNKFEFLGS